jgi:hypothetical protein
MAQLTIQQLFAPAVSGVGPNPPASGSWLATMLGISSTLQLQATAWQSGGIARTMLAVMSTVQAQQDGIVSLMAQGGFLDFAGSGTVTYVNSQGTSVTVYVTPDPSIPSQNPTGVPGWLDELASAVYNVQRIGAVFASGTLYLTNTSGTTYGPYGSAGYHVANPNSGATYSNLAALTIAPSSILGTSNSAILNLGGLIEITTATAHGLATGAIITIVGASASTNANGTWTIAVVDTTHFTLNGSVYASAGPLTGLTYSTQSASFQADKSGSASTSVTGTITQAVTSLVGVQVVNLTTWAGANAQSNTSLVSQCRAKLATISPNGAKNASVYFAIQAFSLLQNQLTTLPFAQYTLIGGPITRTVPIVNTVTGVVTTVVANAGGAVHGAVQLVVSAATNAGPIQITTGTHGLNTGDVVYIAGVTGNTAANGTWTITVLNGTQFTLNGSTGNGAYANGGTVEGSDLGAVDQIIQANVVPNATVELTQTATNVNVALVATVWLPASMVASAAATIQAVLAAYFQNIPIGGYTDDSTALAYTNVVPYNAVLSLLSEAFPNPAGGSYAQNVTLTLNGGTSNIALTTTQVAVLSPTPTVTVNGI